MEFEDLMADIREFLSTPSARRATYDKKQEAGSNGISIHALREEGDRLDMARTAAQLVFLSTPSARRATKADREQPGGLDISIHALREEGDVQSSTLSQSWQYFYPRPPRGGRPT